jgi:vitamin B12 transporter
MDFPRQLIRFAAPCVLSGLLSLVSVSALAAEIHGVVTDASGAKITGATVVLIRNGNAVSSASSGADGSFQVLTGDAGRFYLVISAKGFRQLETPGFYAGKLDNLERNLVLEPEWARESVVVTPSGTPTPQPQTGASTSVLGPLDLAGSADLVSLLRMMPGTSVAQVGQMGAQASLFIRGGDSDDNKILSTVSAPATSGDDLTSGRWRRRLSSVPKCTVDRIRVSMEPTRRVAW